MTSYHTEPCPSVTSLTATMLLVSVDSINVLLGLGSTDPEGPADRRSHSQARSLGVSVEFGRMPLYGREPRRGDVDRLAISTTHLCVGSHRHIVCQMPAGERQLTS